MQRFGLRFAIALLSFIVGVGAAIGWHSIRPRFSRAVEESNIMEVVFRFQIAEESRFEGQAVFFLSTGRDTDPSDEFMQRFEDMRRVRKFSQADMTVNGVTDKQTGERGIILDVHRIEWIGTAEVEVGVGTWGWGKSGSECRVVRENETWEVKSCELTSIAVA